MQAIHVRIVEYIFFFGALGATAYLMWQIISPFFTAVAVAAVVVTVSYPFYQRVIANTPRQNVTVASLVTTLLIIILVLAPLSLLGYLIFTETRELYATLSSGEGVVAEQLVTRVEGVVQSVAPGFSLDLDIYAEQATGWFAEHAGRIFAGTASTALLVFITIIAFFYLFRDGERFVRYLVFISPLPDSEDGQILTRVARSIRSVVLGTLSIALIQGTLTAIGLSLFGIDQAILWGAVAAIGALVPGIGTTIVFIPAIAFLVFEGSYAAAGGLAVWGVLAVGLIDNLLGPYLMSRGVTLHPFLVLLSVLGGIAVFGPIGFVLGPVTLSLFMVLLDLYSGYMHPKALTDNH